MTAHIAAQAAAEEQAKRNLEEEDMTRYTNEDLTGDWEFKILRSATSTFKRPEKLAAVLEYESLGGWQLVEKFDDGRVRLKRPASARQRDVSLPSGYDPYRTQYGMSEGGIAVLVMLFIFGIIALGAGILYFFNIPL